MVLVAPPLAKKRMGRSRCDVTPLPLVLVAMFYVMVGFWFEAGKQERTLREIFRAL